MQVNDQSFRFEESVDLRRVLELDPQMTSEIFDLFPDSIYYFCYVNSVLVGHLAIQMAKNMGHIVIDGENMAGRSYIWAVEIIEEYRGKGLGFRMMKEVLQPDGKYFLRVEKDNVAAINLYKKLGFKFYKENTRIVDGKEVIRDIMSR
jgi:ribosomal protein S18 acetylase RimI-like enzyme